ncbi:MAG: amidase [Frankiaceae bacterium]|nr:amidase [Frankiaceae bacterium]
MQDDELAYAGVRGQLAAMEAGTTTSRALAELSLRRIEALDRQVNAFRVVFAEQALAEADAADAARRAGHRKPLLGLPVAVKDDTDIAGVPTAMGTGSQLPLPTADAPIVARLREAGAVIVGKTNLPELALWGITASSWHGITRNPWDPERTTGGSSGGSAAAVAAGMVALATGSDGLGSLRIPAAACGLATLKPTRGLIPQDHLGWNGMSEVGLLSRDVGDLRLGLEVVAGLEPAGPEPLRLGWTLRAPVPTRLDPEVRRALEATLRAARSMQHRTAKVTVGYGQLSGAAGLIRTWFTGAADDRARLVDPKLVEPRTARLTGFGRRTRRLLPWAMREGDRLRERIDRLWQEVDVLVLPATATLPPRADAMEGRGLARTMITNARWGPFTGTFNASGHPAVVIPAVRTPAGLPVGVQLVGPYGSDRRLLALAATLEEALAASGGVPMLG